MKKVLILWITSVIMVLLILGLVGCIATEPTTEKAVSVEVSIDDFTNVNSISREVEVVKGGTVTVVLGSNKTTGFGWSEQAQISDVTIVEQTSHKYVALEAESDIQLFGAPGKEEWTFKALKSGTGTVSMEYSRPWEGGEKGIWKFTLTVTVKP